MINNMFKNKNTKEYEGLEKRKNQKINNSLKQKEWIKVIRKFIVIKKQTKKHKDLEKNPKNHNKMNEQETNKHPKWVL